MNFVSLQKFFRFLDQLGLKEIVIWTPHDAPVSYVPESRDFPGSYVPGSRNSPVSYVPGSRKTWPAENPKQS